MRLVILHLTYIGNQRSPLTDSIDQNIVIKLQHLRPQSLVNSQRCTEENSFGRTDHSCDDRKIATGVAAVGRLAVGYIDRLVFNWWRRWMNYKQLVKRLGVCPNGLDRRIGGIECLLQPEGVEAQ